MTTSASFPQATLYDVLNALLGAVGGWVAGSLLRRDVGQLFNLRIEAVCQLWRRFEAGKLRRPAARTVVAEAISAAEVGGDGDAVADGAAVEAPVPDMPALDRPARAKPVRLLPHKFGWLLTHMAYRAGPFHSQLTALPQQPRLAAFLEAFPHVARQLRPICRALAIDPALLRLPRKLRVPRERKPRVRKPSYKDVEYRPRTPGEHWVLRVNKWGMRYKNLKD